jgi:hypothetical protein
MHVAAANGCSDFFARGVIDVRDANALRPIASEALTQPTADAARTTGD